MVTDDHRSEFGDGKGSDGIEGKIFKLLERAEDNIALVRDDLNLLLQKNEQAEGGGEGRKGPRQDTDKTSTDMKLVEEAEGSVLPWLYIDYQNCKDARVLIGNHGPMAMPVKQAHLLAALASRGRSDSEGADVTSKLVAWKTPGELSDYIERRWGYRLTRGALGVSLNRLRNRLSDDVIPTRRSPSTAYRLNIREDGLMIANSH